jgi:hypothetical protein
VRSRTLGPPDAGQSYETLRHRTTSVHESPDDTLVHSASRTPDQTLPADHWDPRVLAVLPHARASCRSRRTLFSTTQLTAPLVWPIRARDRRRGRGAHRPWCTRVSVLDGHSVLSSHSNHSILPLHCPLHLPEALEYEPCSSLPRQRREPSRSSSVAVVMAEPATAQPPLCPCTLICILLHSLIDLTWLPSLSRNIRGGRRRRDVRGAVAIVAVRDGAWAPVGMRAIASIRCPLTADTPPRPSCTATEPGELSVFVAVVGARPHWRGTRRCPSPRPGAPPAPPRHHAGLSQTSALPMTCRCATKRSSLPSARHHSRPR